MAFTGPPVTSGDGLDILELDALPATQCYALVGGDMADFSTGYASYRDPKKQRVFFIGDTQSINGGPSTLPISIPLWATDPASTDQRVSIRYFGGVDMSGRTAGQWRDLRGTYANIVTGGGVTTQYDYTIA